MSAVVGSGGKLNTNNLTMLYEPNEPSSYPGSGTTWTNLYNTSNTLTAQGSPTFSTDNGGFFTLNGSSQYFNGGPLGPTGTSARTVNVWAKTSSDSGQMLLSYGNNTGGYTNDTFRCGFKLWGSTEGVSIDVSAGARTYGATVSDNQWHMYTWSASNNTSVQGVSVYMDGVLLTSVVANTGTGQAINTSTSVGIHVGRRHYDSNQYFNGSIGPIAVYNTNLNATQVSALYRVYAGRF